MPGTRITDQQVRLYMNIRKNKSQELAAAKADISERSARRIEGGAVLPSQNPQRYWRSRVDPFVDVWDTQIVPLLRGAPKLMAVTLLRKLQADHPERFPDGMLSTAATACRPRSRTWPKSRTSPCATRRCSITITWPVRATTAA